MSDEDDRLFELVHAGPACTRCGQSGHKTARCRRRVLKEKCGRHCSRCAGMSFRREKPHCPGCRLPWMPEVVIHELPSPGSGCHGF